MFSFLEKNYAIDLLSPTTSHKISENVVKYKRVCL